MWVGAAANLVAAMMTGSRPQPDQVGTCASFSTVPSQQQRSVPAALIWDGVDAAKCPKQLPPNWVQATDARAIRYTGLGAPCKRMVRTRADAWRVHLGLPLSRAVGGKSVSQ